MAIKKLGDNTCYMVGNSDSGTWSNNTDTWYRGWKDFLIWVDTQDP